MGNRSDETNGTNETNLINGTKGNSVDQSGEASLRGVSIVGIQDARYDIEIRGGRFASVCKSASEGPEAGSGGGLWISPGLIDLHTHLAWTDFHHGDQLKRSPAEIEAMQAEAFAATLRAGVTTARDAGGLAPALAAAIAGRFGQPLRVLASGEALGAADARGAAHLERRVKETAASGARWIKVFATGGLGAPPEKVTEPLFSRGEFFHIVRTAHGLGAKVLVHTWGGPTVDWSIEAGADSVEHGIYMTADQAGRMAEAGTDYVPTASIYRLLADPAGPLDPGALFRERAVRAVEAHRHAVEAAKREGVRIGFGTDFATPALHGRNLAEIDALTDYGLTRAEAWTAATGTGAAILGWGDRLGAAREGFIADAVLFRSDPLLAGRAENLYGEIERVLTGRI